jgi:hypothetical protein
MTRELLIFGLDETLVHATTERLARAADFEYEKYFVYKRPFLVELLSAAKPRMTLLSGRRPRENMLMQSWGGFLQVLM